MECLSGSIHSNPLVWNQPSQKYNPEGHPLRKKEEETRERELRPFTEARSENFKDHWDQLQTRDIGSRFHASLQCKWARETQHSVTSNGWTPRQGSLAADVQDLACTKFQHRHQGSLGGWSRESQDDTGLAEGKGQGQKTGRTIPVQIKHRACAVQWGNEYMAVPGLGCHPGDGQMLRARQVQPGTWFQLARFFFTQPESQIGTVGPG